MITAAIRRITACACRRRLADERDQRTGCHAGVYVERHDGSLRFRRVKAPSSAELARLTETLALRIGRSLERQGLLERDPQNSYLAGERLVRFTRFTGMTPRRLSWAATTMVRPRYRLGGRQGWREKCADEPAAAASSGALTPLSDDQCAAANAARRYRRR